MDFYEELASSVEHHSDAGIDNLQNGLLTKACDEFYKAYNLSLQIKDNYAKRACAFNLGATYIAVGKFKEGLRVLTSALPPGSDRDGKSSGDLFFNFGLGYEGIGEKDQALDYYNKAADEYKKQENNPEMAKEVQNRISSVKKSTTSRVTVNHEEGSKDEVTLYAESLMMKAKKHLRYRKLELSEKLANESFSYLQKTAPVQTKGTLYNDLGLLFTELHLFGRAEICFKKAMALVGESSADRDVQKAVVQQNLGAVYNFMGDFQKAIKFHKKAAVQYARLSDKNKESHCYANLAFAYSQLMDWDSAKEAFHTALQGSFQTDDKHTAWQVLEGLGAVYFAEGDIENAITHFQEALNILKESEQNELILNRINGKLQHAVKRHAQEMPMRGSLKIGGRQPGKHSLQRDQGSVHVPHTHKEIPTKRPRYVPVARYGSLRKFDKVAHGLAVQSSLQSTLDRLADISTTSSSSSSSSDSETFSETLSESETESESTSNKYDGQSENIGRQQIGSDQHKQFRERVPEVLGEALATTVLSLMSAKGNVVQRPDDARKTRRHDEPLKTNASGEYANDDMEEGLATQEAMRKELSQWAYSGDGDSTQTKFPERKKELVPQSVTDNLIESSGEDGSSEPPEVPSVSPPDTGTELSMLTYENPVSKTSPPPIPNRRSEQRVHYADIHWEKPSDTILGKESSEKTRTIGPNFFHASSSDDSDSSGNGAGGKLKGEGIFNNERGERNDSKDYDIVEAVFGRGTSNSPQHGESMSIFSQTGGRQLPLVAEDTYDDESVYQTVGSVRTWPNDGEPIVGSSKSQKIDFSGLPRGEQEIMLFEEHQRRHLIDDRPPVPLRKEKDKDSSSKLCSMM